MTEFKKDRKKLKKSKKDYSAAANVRKRLEKGGAYEILKLMLPYNKWKGIYMENCECHIKSDLLIIWFQMVSRM